MSCNEKMTKSAHKHCCNEQSYHKAALGGTGLLGAGYGPHQMSSHPVKNYGLGEQKMPWREMYLALLQQHAKVLGDMAAQFETLNRAYEERLRENEEANCKIAEQGYEEAYKMIVEIRERLNAAMAENASLREKLVACGCDPNQQDEPVGCCSRHEELREE